MRFQCPKCSKTLQMVDALAGKRVRCPICQAIVQTPGASNQPGATKPPTATPSPSSPAGSRQAAQRTATPGAGNPKASPSQPVTRKPVASSRPTTRPAPTTQQPPSGPLGAPLGGGFDLSQFPAPAPNYGSMPQAWQTTGVAKKKSTKSLSVPLLIAIGGGLFVAVLGVVVIVAVVFLSSNSDAPTNVAADSNAPSAVTSSSPNVDTDATRHEPPKSLPQFPDLGEPRTIGDINFYTIQLGPLNPNGKPGYAMKMRVYLPAAALTPKSVPCVLVAPAGTNMLHGNEIDDGEYHDETLPYAKAGMAVIHYSLDGPLADLESFTSEQQMMTAMNKAYTQYSQAAAGVTNGQIAIEFALSKVPQVDPTKIYCAGHSSAATIALELAAKDSRIAKVAAYAPITNLSIRLADLLAEPQAKPVFPNLDQFLISNSPITHVKDIDCPVFLFHARDDSNERWEYTNTYAEALKAAGKDFTFESVSYGDHYQPMISTGIPKAIQWFKK